METLTLGSLFDGIGGFPHSGKRLGITPIWASEIESAPISITKRHFPGMRHLGDITKINGAEIEPVDIITFGSPCQDLSVAGQRAGLDGARSSLFIEAIRIIREMREKTNGIYPAVIVWENVPGAFSSNKGEDFKTVLQEIASVAEPGVTVPRPPGKKGKWDHSGSIMGDGWSMAWRVLDAQYWGVPQRRNRIFLVADFRGERAGEILFKRESLRGDIAEGGETREAIASDAQGGIKAAGFNGWRSVTGTLEYEVERAPCMQTNMPPYAVHQNQCGEVRAGDVANTLNTNSNASGRNAPLVAVHPEVTGTLCASGAELNRPAGMGSETDLCVVYPIHDKATRYKGGGDTRNNDGSSNGLGIGKEYDPCPTLDTSCRHAVAYDCRNHTVNDISATLQSKSGGGQSLNYINPVAVPFGFKSFGEYGIAETSKTIMACDDTTTSDLIALHYAVRRLTPTECERLQGFPDGWTEYGHDGKTISDTQRYRALGNSVAIPCVLYVLQGCVEALKAGNRGAAWQI